MRSSIGQWRYSGINWRRLSVILFAVRYRQSWMLVAAPRPPSWLERELRDAPMFGYRDSALVRTGKISAHNGCFGRLQTVLARRAGKLAAIDAGKMLESGKTRCYCDVGDAHFGLL